MDSTNRSPDPHAEAVRHGRRLGQYGALQTVRRALRQAGPIPTAQALNRLASIEDLTEVIRALEDAADQAGELS